MKKILSILFLFASAIHASTPITCGALSALGHNYLYFGFTGAGGTGATDVFRAAYSNNGTTGWTSLGATWPSCGNGAPCLVNSPSAVCYNPATGISDNEGNLFLLVAEANDLGYDNSKFDVGILNTDFSVTNLATFDITTYIGSIGSGTVFAGRFDKVPGSLNCAMIPVTTIAGYYSWTVYHLCFNLSATSATIASGPTAITITGAANGFYDPQVIQSDKSSSTCTLVGTQTVSGLTFRISALATGSCPAGPFTFATNSTTSGSPLAAEAGISNQTEGPGYIQTTLSNQWYFWFENLPATNGVYYSTCTSNSLATCVISTPTLWSGDMAYRAGTVMWFGAPLPTTKIYGGKLYGGKWH